MVDIFNEFEHNAWFNMVRVIRRYLDEEYTVDVGSTVSMAQRDYKLPWARIGVEKFCDRVVPHISNAGKITERVARHIADAVYNAVAFGNATIIVSDDGRTRVSDPAHGYAERDAFGTVHFIEQIDDVRLVGEDGVLYIPEYENGVIVDLHRTGHRYWSIFYKAKGGSAPFGKSRVTPSIRATIRAASRNKIRSEEGADFYSRPQRILNGIWDQIDPSSVDAIKQLEAGATSLIALPVHPETREKMSVEEFSASSFEPFIEQHDAFAKEVAAAFNLSPAEFGVQTANTSSTDAQFALRDDLVQEIRAFEDSITDTILDMLEHVASAHGEPVPSLRWEEPAAPSRASQADSFSKVASVVPAMKSSRAVLAWAGFPSDVIDEMVEYFEHNPDEIYLRAERHTSQEVETDEDH